MNIGIGQLFIILLLIVFLFFDLSKIISKIIESIKAFKK